MYQIHKEGGGCEQFFASSTTFLNPLVGTNSLYGKRTVSFSLASHCEARALRVRKALTPRFTYFFTAFEKKKPTVLQSTKYNDILETVQDDDLAKVRNIWEQVCGEWSDFERDVRDEIKYLEETVLESNSVISLRVQREVKQPKVSSQNQVQTVYFQLK